MEIRTLNAQPKRDQFNKTRQIAQDYLRIQENTEYLTNMVRFRQNYSRTNRQDKYRPYSIKSIALLTVQLSYFFFACSVKKMNVYISKTFFPSKSRSKRGQNDEICCQYMLQTDFLYLSDKQQQYQSQFFTRHEFSSTKSIMFGKYVLIYINSILNIVKQQQKTMKNLSEKDIYTQFLEFELIIRNYIQPKISTIQSPRIIILVFQESSLFRQHSILVKILNNSIFSQIRNSNNSTILSEVFSYQNTLKSLRSHRNKSENMQQIEELIENTVSYLIRKKVINAKKSMEGPQTLKSDRLNNINNYKGPSSKNCIGSIKGNSFDRRYICEIIINQKAFNSFNHQTYDLIKREVEDNIPASTQKSSIWTNQNFNQIEGDSNQYIIQYYQHKSMLCVKYITSIEMNRQKIDLITFQCNSINATCFHIDAEVIEQQQSRANNNPELQKKPMVKKEKYLALRAWVYMDIIDQPIMKLLLMIDLVMICAKITELQLSRRKLQEQSHWRLQQLPMIIEHTIKLLIFKMEKFYRMIVQRASKKQQ